MKLEAAIPREKIERSKKIRLVDKEIQKVRFDFFHKIGVNLYWKCKSVSLRLISIFVFFSVEISTQMRDLKH